MDGRGSWCGMINGVWNGALKPRDANLSPSIHWCAERKLPLVVMRAVRRIDPGDELLWDYSEKYWGPMWARGC